MFITMIKGNVLTTLTNLLNVCKPVTLTKCSTENAKSAPDVCRIMLNIFQMQN